MNNRNIIKKYKIQCRIYNRAREQDSSSAGLRVLTHPYRFLFLNIFLFFHLFFFFYFFFFFFIISSYNLLYDIYIFYFYYTFSRSMTCYRRKKNEIRRNSKVIKYNNYLLSLLVESLAQYRL